MPDPVSDELKSEILSILRLGGNSCPSWAMSFNGFPISVCLDQEMIHTWGVEFLSDIGLTIDNEWAILCEAHGHVDVPSLEEDACADEDEEDADSSAKNTFFGFRIRSEGVSGNIRFFVFLDRSTADGKSKYVYRHNMPFSLLIDEKCLKPDLPAKDMLLRFPAGQMIFEC